MPAYITPARYREMGLGIDLSAKTDAELRSLIFSASGLVNRFCATPINHDFKGGVVVHEEHPWHTGNQYKRPSGRLWPMHKPLLAVTGLGVYVTKQQHIDFNQTMLFWNAAMGYVEPIAAPITTALGAVFPCATADSPTPAQMPSFSARNSRPSASHLPRDSPPFWSSSRYS